MSLYADTLLSCEKEGGLERLVGVRLGNVGFKRIAIPLGTLPWERSDAGNRDTRSRGIRRARQTRLNSDQEALRNVALMSLLQMVESLEPLLKSVSGKNSEEWSYWWASMMTDLHDPTKTPFQGECLEIGSWWATRL